jgi:hypothetical protein
MIVTEEFGRIFLRSPANEEDLQLVSRLLRGGGGQ